MFIFEMLIILMIWCIIIYEANWFTNKIAIPEWLDWKPLNCFKCHSTWLGIFVYLTLMIQSHWYISCSLGIVLSILTGIAIHKSEKEKGLK